MDKVKAGKLALAIAEKVEELRELVRESGSEHAEENMPIAHDIVMLGAATKRLALKCGVELP